VTTKKITRTVTWREYDADVDGPDPFLSKTSTTEHRFTHDPKSEVSLAEWEAGIERVAAESVASIFDNKTVVLTDSDGGFFAIRSDDVQSATVKVADGLDV
jgi:hypothetical protein